MRRLAVLSPRAVARKGTASVISALQRSGAVTAVPTSASTVLRYTVKPKPADPNNVPRTLPFAISAGSVLDLGGLRMSTIDTPEAKQLGKRGSRLFTHTRIGIAQVPLVCASRSQDTSPSVHTTRFRGTPRRFRRAGSGSTNSTMQSLLAAPPPGAHEFAGASWPQNAGTGVAVTVGDRVGVGDKVGVPLGVTVRVSVGLRVDVGEEVGLEVGEGVTVRVSVAVAV